MSSKVKRLGQQMPKQPEEKTKIVPVRIDLNVDIEGAGVQEKSIYIPVSGVPEDLPKEFEKSILDTARGHFQNALSQRLFFDFFDIGKSIQDQEPLFINITKVKSVQIIKLEIVQ